MKKYLFIIMLLLSGNVIAEISVGDTVKGDDDKIGEVYHVYELDGEKYVAIQYSSNDYGMFNEKLVEKVENENQ